VTSTVKQRKIAFDIDGTLLDPRPKQVHVAQQALLKFGVKEFDEKSYWNLKRLGNSNIEAFAIMGISEEVAVLASEEWLARIEEESPSKLDLPYFFCKDTISELAKKNRLFCVSARKNPALLKNRLNEVGLNHFFEHVFVVDPGNSRSEKADILKMIKPSIFIGDTESDFDASKLAKVNFIGVSCGMRNHRFLQSIGVPEIQDNISRIF